MALIPSLDASPWSIPVRLTDIGRDGLAMDLIPDAETRAAIARTLDLAAIDALQARVTIRPWLDGVVVGGDWSAVVVQTCGVSLEPFPVDIADSLEVRALPAGSPNLNPSPTELSLSPEDDDPPDVIEDGVIDPASLIVEHLSLALDPYPRKPGVEFTDGGGDAPEPSPFAILATLKRKP